MMSRDPSVSKDAAAAGETESDAPSSAHVLVTGHADPAQSVDRSAAAAEGDPVAALRALTGLDDPARAHCPSCGSGVLAVSAARWGCPECGFTVPGARFVLIDDASRPSERRWRRLFAWLRLAAFAYVVGWISLTALFRPQVGFGLFVQVIAFVACGANLWMGRRWRRSPATILTEEGVMTISEGRSGRTISWGDLESWALSSLDSDAARLRYRGRYGVAFEEVKVPTTVADEVRAYLDEHAAGASPPS